MSEYYIYENNVVMVELDFNKEDMAPIGAIGILESSWVAQYYISFRVGKYKKDGMKYSEISKRVEIEARAYNKRYLKGRVFIKTIKSSIKTSIDLEKLGMNTRHLECADKGDGIVSYVFPRTKKAKTKGPYYG